MKSARSSSSKAMRTCSRWPKRAGSIRPARKSCKLAPPGADSSIIAGLAQAVRVARAEVEPVHLAQRIDLAAGRGAEGRLALEGVQHDALEQIAETHVELGGECLQHLEKTGLEPHPGLGAGDLTVSASHVTMLPSYHSRSRSTRTRCGREPGSLPPRSTRHGRPQRALGGRGASRACSRIHRRNAATLSSAR